MVSYLGVPVPEGFVYPALLFLAIPVAIVLLFLTRKRFVREDPRFDTAVAAKRRGTLRWIVFILRFITACTLIIVLATPLAHDVTTREGDARVTVLIDESASMQVLDTAGVDALIEELRSRVPVTVRPLATGESSALGDATLAAIRPNENILLITDGYATGGVSLSQVASFAGQHNATINALSLKPVAFDAAVTIVGPPKAVAGTNETYTVRITRTRDERVSLRVTIDGAIVYDEETNEDEVSFVKDFARGDHKVTAELLTEDTYGPNNRYDALVRVVDKPRILVVSRKSSNLESLLRRLYAVDTATALPADSKALEQYYAVVAIDAPHAAVREGTLGLTQYLLAGNGLLVAGGPASYDYGSYKDSVFESLLPVYVGKAKEGQGVTNIVIAIDMSGSVEGAYEWVDGKLEYKASDKPALVRALALSVLDDLDANHNVGVIVIGAATEDAAANLDAGGNLIEWDYVGGQALGAVSPLGPKRDKLAEAISTLQGGGQAASQYWIAAPMRSLDATSGGKNVIVITDGQSCTQNCKAAAGGSDEAETINLAATLAAQGGRVYTVGVTAGRNDAFLASVATAGRGIFFPATSRNKLRILFGDPDRNADSPDAFGLVVLNPYHFITDGVSLQATLYGYNEVVPRPSSDLLVTAGAGQPALASWHYGVGRVASLTTYNGDDYGELLLKGNSLLISRAVNWAIGDPERKSSYRVDMPPLHVGTESLITVHSDAIPQATTLHFSGAGKDTYAAKFTPAAVGFASVDGIAYAATYPAEYEQVGMNPSLAATLAVSGGRVFDPADTAGIIDYVTTVRNIQDISTQPVRSPFLILAAILFLLEVAVRRAFEVFRAR